MAGLSCGPSCETASPSLTRSRPTAWLQAVCLAANPLSHFEEGHLRGHASSPSKATPRSLSNSHYRGVKFPLETGQIRSNSVKLPDRSNSFQKSAKFCGPAKFPLTTRSSNLRSLMPSKGSQLEVSKASPSASWIL